MNKRTWISLSLLATSLTLAGMAHAEDDGYIPWAPATAGIPPADHISVNKVYVHGIKPSVGMGESVGPPLSAAFLSSVRGSKWAKGREVLGGDEVRLGAPNIGTFIDSCVSGPCVVEVARAVGAGVAISATVSKVGSAFLVDAIAVDARDSSVIARTTDRVRGKDASALLGKSGLIRVTRKLLAAIPALKDKEVAVASSEAQTSPASSETPPADQATDATASSTETTTAATPSDTDTAAATTSRQQTTTAAATETTAASDESTATEAGEDVATLDDANNQAATETSDEVGHQEGASAAPANDDATIQEEGGMSGMALVGLALMGTGAVALAAGGLAHLGAFDADATLESTRHSENQVRSIIEQGAMMQTAAFILYGAGVALGVAGAASFGGGL